MQLESIGAALLLGLAVGPTCLAGISAFYLPLLLSEERRDLAASFRFFLVFSLGRLTGYLTVGLIVGLIVEWSRAALFELEWLPAASELAAGALMLAWGLLKRFPGKSWCKRITKGERKPPTAYLVGLATGLSLCPPFIAAILGASGAGSLLGSMAFFLAFFFGTTLWFVPLTFTGLLTRYPKLRSFADWLVLISGAAFVLIGLYHLLAPA